jgi:serine protease Do
MTIKPLVAAMVTAGVLAAGTAGAIGLPGWLKGEAKATPDTPAATAQTNAPPPVPMIDPGQDTRGLVPDYRAIVKQAGPAVVGVTVAGMHKATADEQQQPGGLPPGMENDPFFQFFRGMPGFQQRPMRTWCARPRK